jgi:hypothetical protein
MGKMAPSRRVVQRADDIRRLATRAHLRHRDVVQTGSQSELFPAATVQKS